MKAITHHRYGSPDVLGLEEVPVPTPGDGEVLLEVQAASVYRGDVAMLGPDPVPLRLAYGLLRPRHPILGNDVAGRVSAVGRGVKTLRPGDEVFGTLSRSGFGALAEFAIAREDALVLKPANLSFQEAAAVPVAAITALQGLRDKGGLQAGQQVLIQGASGGVGTFAVQIARALGAQVTAVCSARHADLVRSLGAHHVIDYAEEDFTRGERRYDLILAVNGHHSIFEYRRALRPGGTCVVVGGSGAQFFQSMLLGPLLSATGGGAVRGMVTDLNRADLVVLASLLGAGEIRPVLDRTYPLRETPDAFRYLAEGHAQGKVAIAVAA